MKPRRRNINARDSVSSDVSRGYATHAWDRYPAKMVPHLARYALDHVSRRGNSILDPFCGCGTVQVEAILTGRQAIGIDINPIAVLLANAKSCRFDPDELQEHARVTLSSARRRLRREWSIENGWLKHWFSPRTLRKLLCLSQAIADSDSIRNPYRDLLRAVLVVSTRLCSRADPRSPKPFISRRARSTRRRRHFDSFKIFEATTDRLACASRDLSERASDDAFSTTRIGDACRLKRHVKQTFDAVITSPPYLAAQDYCRSSKLEISVLRRKDDEHVELGRRMLGSGRGPQPQFDWEQLEWCPAELKLLQQLDAREAAVVLRYINDMKKVFCGIHAVLKRLGKCCMIVGDSTIGGVYLPVHRWLIEVGTSQGFQLTAHEADSIRDRRVPPKRCGHTSLIAYEHLLFFKKTQGK